MKRYLFIVLSVLLIVTTGMLAGCEEEADAELEEGVSLKEELIELLPEEVLGNLFSIKSLSQQDQYWEQYKGKQVSWTGEIYNIEYVDKKVAVSLDYMCQPSQLSHINLHAGIIIYVDESEASSLNKGQHISFAGHLYRRIFWDRTEERPEDVQELQFELGYGSASAVLIGDAELVE